MRSLWKGTNYTTEGRLPLGGTHLWWEQTRKQKKLIVQRTQDLLRLRTPKRGTIRKKGSATKFVGWLLQKARPYYLVTTWTSFIRHGPRGRPNRTKWAILKKPKRQHKKK